jgi:hypothetical protein
MSFSAPSRLQPQPLSTPEDFLSDLLEKAVVSSNNIAGVCYWLDDAALNRLPEQQIVPLTLGTELVAVAQFNLPPAYQSPVRINVPEPITALNHARLLRNLEPSIPR